MDSIVIKTQIEMHSVHVSEYETGVQLSMFIRCGHVCTYLDYGQTVELAAALDRILTQQYKNAREGIESGTAV